ncbi:hypothetical protein, partial [Lactococcus petauri]|uniref:hypothetical protein n=1 Tax=Lactococcus petauri TaxID=1940789 RepID=UPI0021F0F39D
QGPHGKMASLGMKTFPFVPGMPSGGMEDSDHSVYTHPEVKQLLDLPADATWEDQKIAIAQEWMGKDRMSHAAPADWGR